MSKNVSKFEDDLKRLETIVEALESGIGIEEAIKLYDEGIALSKRLEKRLSEIERKVYEVKNIEKVESGEDEKLELDLFDREL
jgi:exodeoxyribonuclease VII small subunit